MTDHRLLDFFSNQRRSDPAGTLGIMTKWIAEMNRRFGMLQTVIRKTVVENDALGLAEPTEPGLRLTPVTHATLAPAAPKQWAYTWNPGKVEGFMAWLREQEALSILEIVQRPGTLRPGGEPWTNYYVNSAYRKGVGSVMDRIRKNSQEMGRLLGIPETELPGTLRPTGGAISLVMSQPFHADRLALMYTRTFDELKGVTSAMDQQISRVLTMGLAQGLNPRTMGQQLADRVDKIGLTRGRLIARTETTNVHQQASLNEMYAAEKATGEAILVEWVATMDSRTRDTHMARHGKVYTKEEAYSLIGEPNCRCALVPYIPAISGTPAKGSEAAYAIVKKEMMKARKALEAKIARAASAKPRTPKAPADPKAAAQKEWDKQKKKLDEYRAAHPKPDHKTDWRAYYQWSKGPLKQIEKLEKVERAAFYRYVPHVTQGEYEAFRTECLSEMIEPFGMSDTEAMRIATRGCRDYPLDLLDQMRVTGHKIIVTSDPGRAGYSEMAKVSKAHLKFSPQHQGGPEYAAECVAHEVAHAIDGLLNASSGSKNHNTGFFKWKKFGKRDLTQINQELLDEFNGLVDAGGRRKGKYSNGDGFFWKDNWIDDYEGRIYSKGETPEWWTMTNQYYWKHLITGSDYTWSKVTQRYPVLAKFLQDNFGPSKRIFGEW